MWLLLVRQESQGDDKFIDLFTCKVSVETNLLRTWYDGWPRLQCQKSMVDVMERRASGLAQEGEVDVGHS